MTDVNKLLDELLAGKEPEEILGEAGVHLLRDVSQVASTVLRG